MSPNTRKFPRTLEQAFGPYARGPVHPMPEPRARRLQDAALYIVSVLAVVFLCALPFFKNS